MPDRDFVLVYGGRDYSDKPRVFEALNRLYDSTRHLVIIQGGARGTDRFAKEWAAAYGVPSATVDALWDYYGNAAGPIRNGWMREMFNINLGVEFPGGSGTQDMRKKLLAQQVPIWYPLDSHVIPAMKAYSVPA